MDGFQKVCFISNLVTLSLNTRLRDLYISTWCQVKVDRWVDKGNSTEYWGAWPFFL